MSSSPFWFVHSDLLASFILAEINTAAQLIAGHPRLKAAFDSPDATDAQRRICFELLAHRIVIEDLSEAIASRWVSGPTLNDSERGTVAEIARLVPDDGPHWAREMELVAEQMPRHVAAALPEPLRAAGFGGNQERLEAVRSVAPEFSTLERLQNLVKITIDTQLQRLGRRWSASAVWEAETPTQPKHWLKGAKGLGSKIIDLSRYMDNLTEKQRLAFSLKNEYGLGLTEIASRMGLDRKTAYEHIDAARRKIDQFHSSEKRKASTNRTPE